MTDSVVLIGPPRAGKTTTAGLLAERLGWPHHELDRLRRGYYAEIGFDMEFNEALYASQGAGAMIQYWRCFQPHAIERFFTLRGVLDTGGGSPLVDHPQQVDRVVAAFAPMDPVVLLLPDPDLERSAAILGARAGSDDERRFQRYAIKHGMFQRLATHTVYTADRSPDQVAEAIEAQEWVTCRE